MVWVCNRADVKSFKKSIEFVNWEVMFDNKSVRKKVSISYETLMNIFSNLTPNKLVKIDFKDPFRMNDFVKSKIKWKNQLYKVYTKIGYKYN